MRKKITAIVAILCVLCLAFLFVACDNQESTTPSGNIGSGDGLPSGNDLPNGTIIIDENKPSLPNYDDNDIDYSLALIIEGDTVTGVTEYGKTLSKIVIPEGVTRIGEDAFSVCLSLTSIEIPNSVTYIGNTAFSQCVSLASIEIPSSVTYVGYHAFSGCNSLTSIEIPNSVKNITCPFYACFSLVIKCNELESEIDYADELEIESGIYAPIVFDCKNNETANDGYIYVIADNGVQYALKDGLAKVSGHSYLSDKITIASNIVYKGLTYQVKEIGSYAFSCAIYIKSIEILSEVTSIGEFAFQGCPSLINIDLPKVLTNIGSGAFGVCFSLTEIEIPSSVTNIGKWAFWGNECLTIYCVTQSQPSEWHSDWNGDTNRAAVVWNCKSNEIADDGCIYYIDDNGIRYALKDGTATVARQSLLSTGGIVMPSAITYKKTIYKVLSICNSAFSGCSALTSIEIPSSVTSIGYYAFYGCSNLTINCEAESQPSEWNNNWNYSKCPVVWGYKK